MNVRQSTAATVIVGPILDADGVAKTDEVVASVLIHKNGGAAGALDGSATLTHSQTGFYRLALTASDLDTLGRVEISLNSGTNSMPVKSINVMTQASYDQLYATNGAVAKESTLGTPAGASIAADIAAIDASGASAAEIWANPQRTLTQSAAQVAAAVSGSTITVHRGDTLEIALTGLGSIAGRSALTFTAKRSRSQADSKALIQVSESGGLLVANGEDADDSTDGSITVDDEAAGNITIIVAATITAALSSLSNGAYDVQWTNADGDVVTLTDGTFAVNLDVTRST